MILVSTKGAILIARRTYTLQFLVAIIAKSCGTARTCGKITRKAVGLHMNRIGRISVAVLRQMLFAGKTRERLNH